MTVILFVQEGIKTSSGANSLVYAISNAAQDKTKAAQFLNFAYTNGDFMDILNWGVEGADWVLDENGQATYPEGVDAQSVGTPTTTAGQCPTSSSATPGPATPSISGISTERITLL